MFHWVSYAQFEGKWQGEKVSTEWIDIAENAGMKFIVPITKHNEGFAMYKSKPPYNLVDFAGYGRDIFKKLSIECAKRDMNLGFYYSQSQDWYEKGGVGNDWDFEGVLKPQEDYDEYFKEIIVMQVKELTSNYGDLLMILIIKKRNVDVSFLSIGRYKVRGEVKLISSIILMGMIEKFCGNILTNFLG